MEKEPKLKTKLEFHFNVDDLELEIPEMSFISDDPIEKKTEITIIKKKKNSSRKSNPKLF